MLISNLLTELTKKKIKKNERTKMTPFWYTQWNFRHSHHAESIVKYSTATFKKGF